VVKGRELDSGRSESGGSEDESFGEGRERLIDDGEYENRVSEGGPRKVVGDEGGKSRSKFLDVDRPGGRGPIERTRSNSWGSKKQITDNFLDTSLARRGS
jgi:hypothetical protein